MAALTRSFPFDTGAGGNVTEAQWREMAKHWVNDGIVSSVGSAMAVTATTGMVLQVAAGAAFIQGHYGALDAATNVTVSAADPTLPRIDRVVLRLDALANAITAEVVAGTPNASPTAPALTQTSATWEISLATVAVAAAATTIVSGNLTDARTLTTPKNGLSGFLSAGARVTVTGAGTPQSPYVVTADAQASTAGAGISISGLTVTAKNRAQLANPFRNSSFQVWQRGTSIAFGSTYAADGWQAHRASGVSGATATRQASSDTQGSQVCGRFQRDSGNTGVQGIYCAQSVTTDIAKHFANKTVTFSFRARCGANFSAASSFLQVQLFTGTGTDQNVLSGYTGSVSPVNTQAVLTTSWQTFTYTVTFGSTVTEMGLYLYFVPVGTAGAADYFEVKDVRLDEGSFALEHIPASYEDDLENARYYLRYISAAAAAYTITALPVSGWAGGIYGGSNAPGSIYLGKFRKLPTVTLTGAWGLNYGHPSGGGMGSDVTAVISAQFTPDGHWHYYCSLSGTAITASLYWLTSKNDTTARLILSGEIN